MGFIDSCINGREFILFSGYSSLPRSTLSEPLGQFTDQSSMFLGHENGIPLLETVSEENRRIESGDHLTDYYRESYDPEITDIDGLNEGLTQATFIGDGIIQLNTLQTTAISNNNDSKMSRNMSSVLQVKSIKKFSLLHTFIPSFFFVILAMSLSAIFILESDSELLSSIRNWPEMNSLRHQYYNPIKAFITSKIGNIF